MTQRIHLSRVREFLQRARLGTVDVNHPELALTNHEADRALRYWIIARRIGMGTDQGARVFALRADLHSDL